MCRVLAARVGDRWAKVLQREGHVELGWIPSDAITAGRYFEDVQWEEGKEEEANGDAGEDDDSDATMTTSGGGPLRRRCSLMYTTLRDGRRQQQPAAL